ncbi:ribonuclease Z [Acinetobacter sp. MB5]|uniref:ribonuclease Z n=1 Tax=Acinetobacter sp. MB5 TaxID=2069438 RepID=UPI000DCFE392|nr:ribonuclease Z [Acinetobacter sp. MB5]
MLNFTFLGTSSGVPTLTRNVAGLAIGIQKSKEWILVDAGEGTQHRLQQARFSLHKLKAICITHVHGDHCYGLVGLLASAGMNARTQPLTIIAPQAIQTWLEVTIQLTDLYLSYPIEFIDVETLLERPHQLNEVLSIQTHRLHHRVPSYAFSVVATHVQKKLDTAALQALGIPKGKVWGDLQSGQDIEFEGENFPNRQFFEITSQQIHAVIAGDNDQPELLNDVCATANLLIHEATYTQAILDKVGTTPMHSSAKMLAEFAEKVHLPHLILTHISARYHDAQGSKTLKAEVEQYYSGQFWIAHDFDRYELDLDGNMTKTAYAAHGFCQVTTPR